MMSCQRLSSRALQELVNTFRLRRNLAVGPSTAKIFYTARNYLAGKIPGELVFAVDKWPDFSAVMCAVGEGTYQYLQDIETYTFYWENNQGLLRLLRDAKFVDWDETFTIAGFSERGLPLLNQVCHDMNKPPPTNDTMTHCNTAFFTGQIIGNDSPPSPLLTIGPLEVQHAELVNRVWRWGGQSKVLEFLQYIIRTFPSRCLYDENDQPLSFSVAQPWGEVGPLYSRTTRSDHGTIIFRNILKNIQEAGDLPYVYAESRLPRLRTHAMKVGGHWDPFGSCYWVYIS